MESTRRLLLHEITRTEAAERAPHALAVMPVGATEQHGPHLPLGTDFLIVEHVARQAASLARNDGDVLVTPTLPFGSSHHHLPFGGTISMATEQYFRAMRDMVESLVTAGFRRIFILNGHGGNHEIIQLVARDLALRLPANFGTASYWDLGRDALTSHDPSLRGRLPGHAGHFETAAIMALRPDLVSPNLPQRSEEEAERSTTVTPLFRAERHGFWPSIGGHTDTPHAATAAQGEEMLAILVEEVAAALRTFARLPLN